MLRDVCSILAEQLVCLCLHASAAAMHFMGPLTYISEGYE